MASLAGLRRYYGEGGRAQTWEFQMLTRLRYAAGSAPVAAAATEILSPRVYRDPMPESWPREIWEMRLRMERERVPPEQCLRHLKLGPGGLADIEFLLQLLQLRHGGARPELRELSPRSLLRRMEAAGLLSRETALRLEEGLDFLTSLRLRLALLGGEEGADLLPEADDFLARPLARSMSVRSFDELQERHRALTGAIRAALQGWVMGDGL